MKLWNFKPNFLNFVIVLIKKLHVTKEVLFLMCCKRIYSFFSFAKIWAYFWTGFPKLTLKTFINFNFDLLSAKRPNFGSLSVASKKSEFKCMSRSFSFAAGTFFYSVSQDNYAAHFLISSISVNTLGFKRCPFNSIEKLKISFLKK